ncbi:Legume lectin, beta chain, Mn/Ca-binding site protein, partial [Actinidia chinensis var. chinensis]
MGSAAKLRFIVVLLCFTVFSAQNLTTFTGTYGPFNQTIYSEFEFVDEASVSNGALQLTPDTALGNRNKLLNQPLGTLQDRSGRVMLKQPFKLWDYEINHNYDNGRVASFNSSFLINAYAFDNITAGEGLAFVVAPDLGIPSRSYGQYLGLTNYDSDGNPVNQLVAVELDTFEEAFDPDANHVGLNINSIVSNITTALTPLGIEIAPKNEARFYNVWVQYDGVKKFIEVYMEGQVEREGQTPPRPTTPVLKADLDLR